MPIAHDQLFKELLRACFAEFIELFLPEVYAYLDPASLEFIEQESANETTAHAQRAVDLLVKARFKGRPVYFLIHVEVQASKTGWSSQRMFTYFASQSLKHDLPLYPIALLTWERPLKRDAGQYAVDFPNRRVLEFNYDVIQLNRYDWRAYRNSNNPAAIALMAKMGVEPQDRPKLRADCIVRLLRQRLPDKRKDPLMRFVDAYLRLNTTAEREEFKREIKRLKPRERKEAMTYMTSWERSGYDKGKLEGKHEGKLEGKVETTVRQLIKRIGKLNATVQKQLNRLSNDQLDELSLAVLDFQSKADLNCWLKEKDTKHVSPA